MGQKSKLNMKKLQKLEKAFVYMF